MVNETVLDAANQTLNLTVNDTIHGTGNMMVQGANGALDGWLGGLTAAVNAALSFFGIQMGLTPDQVGLILFLASVVLLWLRLKAIMEILQQYIWAAIVLLVLFVLAGPVMHLLPI